jgi:cell division septation protein DedD
VYSDSTASSTSPYASSTPATIDSTQLAPGTQPTAGFTVSFAALLTEDKAQQLASTIRVGATPAHVVVTSSAGSPIFRVVMGPFSTKEEAERVGRASRRDYWIYEGSP